jgi:hypothetical protein
MRRPQNGSDERETLRYHRAMHPRSLLKQLTVTPLDKPCDSPWESMAGTDKVRRCVSCDRDVYSLSDMTELEAELRLLNSGEAVPCIRYARDRDGLVRHLAPPPPPRRFHAAGASARALVVASALVARDALAEGKDKPNEPPAQCVMLSAPESVPGASAMAPAKGAPAPAAPAKPPEPVPLAGAAPPPRHEIAFGTLTIRSKEPRELEIQGLKLQAPLALYRMTPGDFVAQVSDPGKKKKRKVKFSIKVDQLTTVDLDKQ